jgi:hypothetical protein
MGQGFLRSSRGLGTFIAGTRPQVGRRALGLQDA